MRLYNGCPDSKLKAKWDSETKFRKKLSDLCITVTYFPVEDKYMGFLNYRSITGFFSSLYSAGYAALEELNIMISDKIIDVVEQIGEGRFKHIQQMKAFAMKQGKCKELHEGVCSYPHCQCLFIGLEDGEMKDKTDA